MTEKNQKELKETLTAQIMNDIQEMPFMYLPMLQAMVHAFKDQVAQLPGTETVFDWYQLMKALEKNEQVRFTNPDLRPPQIQQRGNYDKEAFLNALKRAEQKQVFKNITNAVEWQKKLRNETE